MQSPTRKMDDIDRLLSNYPPPNSGAEPEQVVRNYLFAVEDYHADDVERAVDAFLKGSVPGTNAAFLPTAPVLAGECRRQLNLRLDSEYRTKMARPKLPPPDIERTADSQARVRELMATAVANLQRVTEETNGDQAKRKAEQWQRTNSRFNPSADERDMEARLGFSVGDDAEGEWAA